MADNRPQEVAPGFTEIFLPEQLLIDGKLFPRAFSPSSPHLPPAHIFHSNRLFLEQQLLEHGALFLRGFPLQSGQDFNSVVEAIGWDSLSYVGSAPRTKVVGDVYTANDSNPDVSVPFHHEMVQVAEGWPSKLLFFCETNAAEGGQTPIVLSRKVTEKMWQEFPEFMEKLDELGLLYLKILPKEMDPEYLSRQGWPLVFGTSDPKEAEQRAMNQFTARVEWLADESLKMISGPFKGTRSFGRQGQNAWFNAIAVYFKRASTKTGLSSDTPYDVIFGDGSRLPADAVEASVNIIEDLSVDIAWQKGDLMIVDNFAVMHGRRPYKPPRRVLVFLCK